MANDKQFYVGQKAVIEKGGEVLVLNDPWFDSDLPGGKIQEGETDFAAALKREVFEETGLTIEVGEPFAVGYFEVPVEVLGKRHPNAGKKVFKVIYKAKYVSGEIRLSDEHNAFTWVNKIIIKR